MTRTIRLESDMTVHHNPSSSIVRHIPSDLELEDIRNFIARNADDLLWVATATGGRNGRAAASDLIGTVLSDTGMAEDIEDLLLIVRDFLCDGASRASNFQAKHRPDLDAAIRWMGGRLDELIRKFA